MSEQKENMLPVIPYPIKTSKNYAAVISATRYVLLLVCVSVTVAAYSQGTNSVKPEIKKFIITDTFSRNNIADTLSKNSFADDDYDAAPITLVVEGIGSIEIQAYLHKDQVYLPVTDVFNFLLIKNIPSADYQSISGFFIEPQAVYRIDKKNNRISYREKIFTLTGDELVLIANTLFLKSDYFGQVFGLDCHYDMYNLSVSITTKIQLPALRDKQLDQMHRNLKTFTGEPKADTAIGRHFTFFNVGTADWLVQLAQANHEKPLNWFNLGIGAVLAGGELNLLLNYRNNEPLGLKQQFYKWRYVNNNHAALRQVTLGKLIAASTASLYGPVVGVQLTNTPTAYRRSFGNYIISNKTEPGWMVELYINDVLINFTTADGSGFYMFDVPMVYGNSAVKLKFYGPWGEERTSEKILSIPFNFVPLHQFEYTVTAGVVEDKFKSKFGRANFNYGLSRRITVGGGMEYLSGAARGKIMPYVHAAWRAGERLLVSGEYAYGVRSKWILNYRLKNNLQFDLSYTRYNKDQTLVLTNYLDEKRMMLSLPLRRKKLTGFTRLTVCQYTFAGGNYKNRKMGNAYTTAEWVVALVKPGVGVNLTTYAVFNDSRSPLVYSNISFNFRLPAGIRFTPQVQYEYRQHTISSVKAEAEKNIFNRCYLNLAYERINITRPQHSFTIGCRYDLNFAQSFFSVRKSSSGTAATQLARGSFLFDGKTKYLAANDQNSVGKGGVVIVPYLDMKVNGRRDAGEPKATGLNLRMNGGHIIHNKKDSTIRITGLEAYMNYFIEFDVNSIGNIGWQLKKQSMQVTVQPNEFTLIEVPVVVYAEVSGNVYITGPAGKKGLGRMIVNIYNSNGELAGRAITEPDGYFSFMGLAPGNYMAQPDPAQLEKLQMVSTATSFTVNQNPDGDYITGINFILLPVKK
jgi:hypothetical protein